MHVFQLNGIHTVTLVYGNEHAINYDNTHNSETFGVTIFFFLEEFFIFQSPWTSKGSVNA